MKIDLSKIDNERFHINSRSIPSLGDFVLIVPHKAMWEWNENELHLRSLMCRPDGEVVSAGFPKFFNFGERPDNDQRVELGLAQHRTRFTEKVDGSLIIRSVFDGNVHFRTRGCEVIASDMREEVEKTIRDKYWKLLDPEFFPDSKQSMLLEFVSPKNQIVVRYDEPKMVYLGLSQFASQNLRVVLAPEHPHEPGMPEVVSMFNVTFDETKLKAVSDGVINLKDQEGTVTWTTTTDESGAQQVILTKFKSAWYLRLHALRSQATPRYLKEFCYFNKVNSLEELKEAFYKEGFDWEIVSYIEPMFTEIEDRNNAIETVAAGVDTMLSRDGVLDLPTRKDKALASKKIADNLRAAGFGEWFGYIMSRSLGEDVTDHVDALKMGMGLQQFKQFKKTGPEKLGAGSVIDDG